MFNPNVSHSKSLKAFIIAYQCIICRYYNNKYETQFIKLDEINAIKPGAVKFLYRISSVY